LKKTFLRLSFQESKDLYNNKCKDKSYIFFKCHAYNILNKSYT